jgi:hypothetical protein
MNPIELTVNTKIKIFQIENWPSLDFYLIRLFLVSTMVKINKFKIYLLFKNKFFKESRCKKLES